MDASLSFWKRVGLAWEILFDSRRASELLEQPKALTEAQAEPAAPAAVEPASSQTSAFQLLALFQREGRLIDFLQQDVQAFSDEDIGAAARVVHEGCRKALRAHAQIEAIRQEKEGGAVSLGADFDRAEIKLTGAVAGQPPYRGVLRHRGWRIVELTLPTLLTDARADVVAQAEVEL